MHSRLLQSLPLAILLSAAASPFFAQSSAGQTPPPAPPPTDTRPATTTVNGDTGLWFVPTGEVVPAKKYAISAYRVNFDRDQGFTDVSDWPVTFAFEPISACVGGRAPP